MIHVKHDSLLGLILGLDIRERYLNMIDGNAGEDIGPEKLLIQPNPTLQQMIVEKNLISITDTPTIILDRLDQRGVLSLNSHLSDKSITESLLDRIHNIVAYHNRHLEDDDLLQGDYLIRASSLREEYGLIHDTYDNYDRSFRATFGSYQAFYYDLQPRCGAAWIQPIGGQVDPYVDHPRHTPLLIGYSWRPVHISLTPDTTETAMFFIPVKVWQIA